jgi:hypothetical protein
MQDIKTLPDECNPFSGSDSNIPFFQQEPQQISNEET